MKNKLNIFVPDIFVILIYIALFFITFKPVIIVLSVLASVLILTSILRSRIDMQSFGIPKPVKIILQAMVVITEFLSEIPVVGIIVSVIFAILLIFPITKNGYDVWTIIFLSCLGFRLAFEFVRYVIAEIRKDVEDMKSFKSKKQ